MSRLRYHGARCTCMMCEYKRKQPAPILDFIAAQEARDQALTDVAKHAGEPFMDRALREIAKLHGEFTGEDIRVQLTALGIAPHHNNAWGAVVMTAVRRGLLEDTGRSGRMKAVKSHARRTPIFRAKGS